MLSFKYCRVFVTLIKHRFIEVKSDFCYRKPPLTGRTWNETDKTAQTWRYWQGNDDKR